MAKFNTEKIPNFDQLSDSEKIKALLDTEIPDELDLKKYVAKDVFDKKASEAAEYHRQLKEKMSEEERKAAESEAQKKDMQEKYEALLKETTIAKEKAKFISLGMDESLAEETAQAHFNGDTEKVFANLGKLNELRERKLREELVRGAPQPGGKSGGQEGDDEGVKLAKALGANRANTNKSVTEQLEKYYKK